MKRLIALILVLLLLSGCTVQQPAPSTQPTQIQTQPTTEPTQPLGPGIYEENSTLEQQTDGAVKMYIPEGNGCTLFPLGGDLLLYCPGKQTALCLYTGETLRQKATVLLDASVSPEDLGIQVTPEGVSYYDADAQQVVLLDAGLQETGRINLPENALGIPAVDRAQQTVYFCTENEIRALHMETGIAVLLRQETVAGQSISGLFFDGRVLLCDATDGQQNRYLAYINTENGKLMGRDGACWDLDSCGNAFLLTHGQFGPEALYGTWDGEVRSFVPRGEDTRIWSALALDGAVAVSRSEDGLILDFYNLESGLRTASVTLTEGTGIRDLAADGGNRCVWLLLEDTDSGKQMLCRWDFELSATADETVYLTPRYTEEYPDVEGISQCQSDAQTLGFANAMEIRIWKDAVTAPWEKLQADYRVDNFFQTLDAMEQVLSVLPKGMTAKLASLSDNGVTTVSLVRGAGETAQSQLQWYRGSIYIALETETGSREAFCNALYRAMDTYILNSNSMLDEWNSKDPVGDRAMFFQYAMSEDMEEYFSQQEAQKKLKQLCKAIRDAFDLKEAEDRFLWEQYLEA